jgi:hypothetical protein
MFVAVCAAPLIRDRCAFGACNDPGPAAHDFALLCARDWQSATPPHQIG